MKRAEGGPPAPDLDPRDPVGLTRAGYVVRRNGDRFAPGPHADFTHLPLV